MEVIAITNEGRFRSKPIKTRTLKDECLYLIKNFIFLITKNYFLLFSY